MSSYNFNKMYLPFIISSLFLSSCNSTGSSSNSYITTTASLSPTLPYSTAHAGLQTPVMVIFSAPINPKTVESTSFYIESSGGLVYGNVSVSEDNESAIFTPAGPLNYGVSYTVHATASITDSSGNQITPLTTGNIFTTQPESYTIFATSSTYTGKIGDGGISSADQMCAQEPSCPESSVCKAMLVDDSGTRVAAPIPVNWVLQPYTAYKNINSNNFIGITGIASNGTSPTNIPLNSAVFGFNIQTPILKLSSEWTGMNPDWTTAIGYTCNNWESSSGIGIFGSGNSESSSLISNTTSDCSSISYIYCIQQP